MFPILFIENHLLGDAETPIDDNKAVTDSSLSLSFSCKEFLGILFGAGPAAPAVDLDFSIFPFDSD